MIEWQHRFGTEEACIGTLFKVLWPRGFIGPKCSTRKYSFINSRLVKWFWAIYLAPSDKGGISASRLSKHIDVSWVTAQRILRKIRTVMAQRDSIYRLKNLIEFDDTLFGGKKNGKKSVVVAVDKREKHAGFMAAATVEETSKESVQNFLQRHLIPGQEVRTDAFPALNSTAEKHNHHKKVTPPEVTGKWLPLVHIVVGNLKTFLNGIFHGVSGKYLAEDIGEFCYRFNRLFREHEQSLRLLNACLAHVPI